ncbi:MAG: hypothetical protein AAGF12_13130, partial [Myxococcota bacterium]
MIQRALGSFAEFFLLRREAAAVRRLESGPGKMLRTQVLLGRQKEAAADTLWLAGHRADGLRLAYEGLEATANAVALSLREPPPVEPGPSLPSPDAIPTVDDEAPAPEAPAEEGPAEDGTKDAEDGTKDAEDGRKDAEDGTKDAEDGTKDAEDGTKDADDGTK